MLDPEQQLDPLEAPEPEIAVERIAGNDLSTRNRAQLGQEAANDRRECSFDQRTIGAFARFERPGFANRHQLTPQKHSPTAALRRRNVRVPDREESEQDGCHENF